MSLNPVLRSAVLANLELLADLPAISPVVAQLTTALWRDDVALSEIEELIAQDPVVAARLLSAANAAAYAGYAPVASLRGALLRLGIERTRRLALVVSVCNVMPGLSPPPARFWRHSVAVAHVADALAREAAAGVEVETAFLTGLIHDLGLLVLRSHYPEHARAAAEHAASDGVPLVEIERQLYGIDHAEIGAALAGHWSLPAVVTAATRFHHAPLAAPEEQRATAAVIRLAEAATAGPPADWDLGEGVGLAENDPALALVGLTAEAVGAAMQSVMSDIASASALLGR